MNFLRGKFSNFSDIKNLDLDSDPDLPKSLDPDPNSLNIDPSYGRTPFLPAIALMYCQVSQLVNKNMTPSYTRTASCARYCAYWFQTIEEAYVEYCLN